jgi:pimeloyl-ACP methyl ester carboxylesterase
MQNKAKSEFDKYIKPLNVNGLTGRMLSLPSRDSSRNNFLLIYDVFDSLENMNDLAILLNKFGSVSCIDLPGMGGMRAFNILREKPTLDIFADYLAAIVKLRFRRKRITIVGIGYGFVIATKMLQRNPEIIKKVNLVISLDGYARYDDFELSSLRRKLLSTAYWIGSYGPFSALAKISFFNSNARRLRYKLLKNDAFYKQLTPENQIRYLNSKLLASKRINLRTYFRTKFEILTLDNCHVHINTPIWHVSLSDDKKNQDVIIQHLQVIYSNYYSSNVKVDHHILIMLNSQISGRLVPPRLRRLLSKMK